MGSDIKSIFAVIKKRLISDQTTLYCPSLTKLVTHINFKIRRQEAFREEDEDTLSLF